MCNPKSMILVCLYSFLITGFLGCKKDDERNDCGGDLTANPEFRGEIAQFKINGELKNASLINYEGGITTASSDTLYYGIGAGWQTDNTIISVGIGNDYTNYHSSSSPFYELAMPGQIMYTDSFWEKEKYVLVSVYYQGMQYFSFGGDNVNSYFEITRRSGIIIENGDSVATIEGLFCCTVYGWDSLRTSIAVQGNFSTKMKVNQ
jgi:hypothetical protein